MRLFTFAFDDGYESWVEAAGTLQVYGFRGVFNCTLRNVVQERKLTRPRMFSPSDVITWDEMAEMQAQGHEIGSHGVRHIDLGTANTIEIMLEIDHSQRVFASRGIQVDTYASQFNSSSMASTRMGLWAYRTFRAGVRENILPFAGGLYHGQAPGDALKVEHGEWRVAIFHDVQLVNFADTVDRVARIPEIEVVTVREAIGD